MQEWNRDGGTIGRCFHAPVAARTRPGAATPRIFAAASCAGAQQLRQLRLARYSAASACCNRSIAASALAGQVAMPMLTVSAPGGLADAESAAARSSPAGAARSRRRHRRREHDRRERGDQLHAAHTRPRGAILL
ncbi:hypothetical protein GGR77_001872 [Xanthomonas translucens]